MAEGKHTPGPWRSNTAFRELDCNLLCSVSGPDGVIARSIKKPDDARLIAAAPDLLAASMKAANELRQAARALAKAGDHKAAAVADMAEERTRAAIAKATGAA